MVVPREHSTCQWPHAAHSSPKLAGLGGTPHHVSLCTPTLHLAQEGINSRPLLGTLSSLEIDARPATVRVAAPTPWAPAWPANAGHLRSYLSSSLAKAESAPAET